MGAREKKSNSHMWMVGPMAGQTPSPKGWTAERGPRGGVADVPDKARGLKIIVDDKDRNGIAELEGMLQDVWSRGGKNSKAYLDACERLTRAYNNVAMRSLQGGDNAQALELLQSAEGLIAEAGNHHNLDELRGITYNNLGCYFRREGMPMEALKWLRQAHDIEQRSGGHSGARSSTFLNLCAVYSLLGRHNDALQCAQQVDYKTAQFSLAMPNHAFDMHPGRWATAQPYAAL